MQWLHVITPVLAILLVIIVAVLGAAFVSAIEAFQKIFGRDAADDEPREAKSGEEQPTSGSLGGEERR